MFDDTVHIVPFGFEYERVLRPIEEGKADTAVLVKNESDMSVSLEFQDELQEKLENDSGITLDTRYCDIFDMYESMETILKSISDYSDDAVYVNLATGTKVTAVSGMIACMATHAEPFYVQSRLSTADRPTKDELPKFDEVVGLPDYPIEKPTDDQIRVMEYIYTGVGDSTTKKKDIIDFADGEGLEFASGSDKVSEKALYPRLNSHIIDPLTEKGFLRTEERGNTTKVHLTEEGEKAIRAFRHIV
jgi:hypothetical protein